MPWKCDFCTFVNYRDAWTICEICNSCRTGAARPNVDESGSGDQPGTPPLLSFSPDNKTDSFKARYAHRRPRPPAPVKPLDRPSEVSSKLGSLTGLSGPSNGDLIDSLFQSEKDERTLLLDEILESERAYVDSLCILVTHFVQPLERQLHEGDAFVSEKNLQSIFSNVAQIMSLNVELLRVIETELCPTRIKDGSGKFTGPRVGSDLSFAITTAFKEVIPYFKMYSWYVNNYGVAVETLKSEQLSNKKFAKFLEMQHSHEICKGLDLGAYLIMPVQRLCKYPLLFGRLLQITPKESLDYETIKQVTQVVNEITGVVDLDRDRAEKSLRGFEIANFLALDVLSKRMGQSLHLLEPGRMFTIEWVSGLSKHTTKRSSTERKIRTMFLFSNLLIIAKKGSKGYDAKVWMDLNHAILGDISPCGESQNSGNRTPKRRMTVITKMMSVPGIPGDRGTTEAEAALNGCKYDFSMVYETVCCGPTGRLSLGRNRSKSKVNETYTFHFETDHERTQVHEIISQTLAKLQRSGITRPRSSHGYGEMAQEDTRQTRSLSPDRENVKYSIEEPEKTAPKTETSEFRPVQRKRPPAPTKPRSTSAGDSPKVEQKQKVLSRMKSRPPAPTLPPNRTKSSPEEQTSMNPDEQAFAEALSLSPSPRVKSIGTSKSYSEPIAHIQPAGERRAVNIQSKPLITIHKKSCLIVPPGGYSSDGSGNDFETKSEKRSTVPSFGHQLQEGVSEDLTQKWFGN
mmetsp:Transcript_39110/g.63188  ORF Transcript_39110/g.63188 Transcript_39110/m.63188 type:complete len:741 (-) Transcript_39110:4872-7094(-)